MSGSKDNVLEDKYAKKAVSFKNEGVPASDDIFRN